MGFKLVHSGEANPIAWVVVRQSLSEPSGEKFISMKLLAALPGRCSFALLGLVLASCKNAPRAEHPPVGQNARPASQRQGVTCNFEWVDPKKQVGVWAEISNAFREELLPDQQSAGTPGPGIYAIKRIARVARCGDAMMVVLEKRTNEKESDEWDRPFELYNFKRTKNEKSPITGQWTFWRWQFDKLARFEDGPAPDIVFESESCTECEPAIILSALRFDPKEERWELRRWPKGDEGILITDAAVGIDGSVEEYETLSGIADFYGNGHDEVAVWTYYRDVNEKGSGQVLAGVTTLHLYGVQSGTPIEVEVKDKSEMTRFKKTLCEMNPKDSACLKQPDWRR